MRKLREPIRASLRGGAWAARLRSLVAVAMLSAGAARGFAADARPDFTAALALYEARRYSEAREAFGRLTEPGRVDVELDFYAGRLALWFDDGDAALARLERAARAAPDDARIQNALGDAYGLAAQRASIFAKLGWAQRCRAAYERAVTLAPRVAAYRWSLVGFFLVAPRIAGGEPARAHAEAREIARLDPMGGRIAQATLWLAEKKPAAAFALFDEVLRDSPDDFLALYHVGRCAALSGEQIERGLVTLRRCLELQPPIGDGMPTLACVHYRMGNLLEKQGQAAAARVEYALATQVHPDFRPEKIALKN